MRFLSPEQLESRADLPFNAGLDQAAQYGPSTTEYNCRKKLAKFTPFLAVTPLHCHNK
jgi:hypothetical protein